MNNTPISGSMTPEQKKHFAVGIVAIIAWWVSITNIVPFSVWMTYTVLGIAAGTPLGAVVEFFIYDVTKILLLLIAMIYVIALARASLHVDKVRDYLKGRGKFTGYGLGALFGSVTPFCSCSSIPLFLGFASAGIPLGATMSFLITSPIINEVAVVLLWGVFGWKFTLAYIAIGLTAGIIGGIVMDYGKAERWLQPYLQTQLRLARQSQGLNAFLAGGGRQDVTPPSMTLWERHCFALDETKMITKQVWIWVVIGVGVGAGLHGYVPDEWMAEHLGAGEWWTVPAAVLAGIPLYGSATGIIPIMESLLLKGLPLGTTLALCMSTIAISLPELLMLRQVMQVRLLAFFVALMFVLFTMVGWLCNSIEPFLR